MSSWPDPAELDELATRIAEHADTVHRRARSLADAVTETRWQGVAARAFHGGAEDTLAALRHAADRLDDAADALRRHAATVRRVVHDAQELLHDSGRLVGDVGHTLHDALTGPRHLLDDAADVTHDAARVTHDAVRGLGHLAHLT